ncbi:hypothetical protein BJ166DRAFT_627812 [Pestalotiopsis sp. NC0098]|nr:hypothetical protein BJ166DRAFT_627812 [Pestalotiopsis sp. NC0098]
MPGIFSNFKQAVQMANNRQGVGLTPGTRNKKKSASGKKVNDWRVCAKKDCQDISEAFSKGAAYGYLASPYCSTHACQHWAHGQSCKTPTKKNQPYCEIHTRCSLPGCTNPPKGEGKKVLRWCIEHACNKDGCKNNKEIKNSNLNSKFCSEHTCKEGECLEMEESALQRCKKHTCAWPTCFEPVTPKGDPKDDFCARHRCCYVDSCNQDVQFSNGNRLKFCKNHCCEFGHGCDEQRQGTSVACDKHICVLTGCNNKRSDTAGSLYCSDGDHECKASACTRESYTLSKSSYCIYHICREYQPPVNCSGQGEQQKGGYCDKHERCEESGCNNVRAVNSVGDRQTKCSNHLSPCNAAGCSEPKVADRNYCSSHVCVASNDCPNSRYPPQLYCDSHKCTAGGCLAQRRPVAADMTMLLGYLNQGVSGLKLPMGSSPFCAQHACSRSDCNNGRKGDGKFCGDHTCTHSDACAAEVQDGKNYCAAHTCQSGGCGKQVFESSHFCSGHKCYEPGCNLEATSTGRYAGWCRWHEVESDDSDDDSDDSSEFMNGSGRRQGGGRRYRSMHGGGGFWGVPNGVPPPPHPW